MDCIMRSLYRKKVSFWVRVERALVPVIVALDVILVLLAGFAVVVYLRA